MDDLFEKIHAAAGFIRRRLTSPPEVGIILGSGLGGLSEGIEAEARIPYSEIPHFPVSTVEGHSGELILGKLHGRPVAAMAGRFHYYEGYSMKEVTFPVRVFRALGISTLLVSNAAGGMNPGFRVGDIMIITDHINLMGAHPLTGANDPRLGARFPDMSEPYDRGLIELAERIAARHRWPLTRGVYAGVGGPSFETRAEYRYLRTIGADAVGMSTVPEVIVAVHGGMKVFAVSVITDLGIREEDNAITHEEVLEAAGAAAPRVSGLFGELAREL